jgi:predicted transcriptional regulator
MCSTTLCANLFRFEAFAMTKTKKLEKQPASTKVNLTIKIDKALLRKIRIIAAEQGTSISALVADAINEKSTQSGRYEEAMKRALTLMEEGIPFEGPMLTREQMHERR